jgi:predicted DNA-binding transcriptional regulator AlpA
MPTPGSEEVIMANDDSGQVLSARGVARKLGLSAADVRDLIEQGQLPDRLTLRDIERWVERRLRQHGRR